ncbi:MAG: choline dehydrogenase [Rhodobacteraceae bacterium HLUCCA12]|nr:MAG: choline dehydrogenase [Rhodobacteraceae bacterium HLUCCA12]
MSHEISGSRSSVYDFVIVGAGSAGCVLANRLSADPACRVLLIEAGGWDRDPFIKIPIGWGRIMQKRLHDWGYETEPDPMLGIPAMECMRGRVIGGSSSINAMAYVRGHAHDFDRWASYGLPSLGYENALRYFRRQETWEDGASEFRGGAGPLSTIRATYADPLAEAFLEAADATGMPWTDDYNGAQQEGFSVLQSTIRNGWRCSAADAYLRPALGRPNLTVTTNSVVTSVEFSGDRAVSVAWQRSGRRHRAHAENRIILCAGAINTPQILMLSGIGDSEVLSHHGIETRVHLPGVGRNLQDHASVAVEFARKGRGPFVENMRMDRLVAGLTTAYMAGRGFGTDLPSGWTAFLRTPLAGSMPDIQLIFRAVPLSANPWFPGVRKPFLDGFAIRAVLLRPKSRGHVALRSADPFDKVRIVQNLLHAPGDRAVLREGLRMIPQFAGHKVLEGFIDRQLAPGPGQWSDQGLDAHILGTVSTAHHPAGTCRMGLGGDGCDVSAPDFSVYGTQRLSVVDASVFPDLVGGNINAAVIMLAEMASDFLSGKHTSA